MKKSSHLNTEEQESASSASQRTPFLSWPGSFAEMREIKRKKEAKDSEPMITINIENAAIGRRLTPRKLQTLVDDIDRVLSESHSGRCFGHTQHNGMTIITCIAEDTAAAMENIVRLFNHYQIKCYEMHVIT